jgi:hypothetical protein
VGASSAADNNDNSCSGGMHRLASDLLAAGVDENAALQEDVLTHDLLAGGSVQAASMAARGMAGEGSQADWRTPAAGDSPSPTVGAGQGVGHDAALLAASRAAAAGAHAAAVPSAASAAAAMWDVNDQHQGAEPTLRQVFPFPAGSAAAAVAARKWPARPSRAASAADSTSKQQQQQQEALLALADPDAHHGGYAGRSSAATPALAFFNAGGAGGGDGDWESVDKRTTAVAPDRYDGSGGVAGPAVAGGRMGRAPATGAGAALALLAEAAAAAAAAAPAAGGLGARSSSKQGKASGRPPRAPTPLAGRHRGLPLPRGAAGEAAAAAAVISGGPGWLASDLIKPWPGLDPVVQQHTCIALSDVCTVPRACACRDVRSDVSSDGRMSGVCRCACVCAGVFRCQPPGRVRRLQRMPTTTRTAWQA